jgi:hypothetical protein
MRMPHRPTSADVIGWFKDEKAKREAGEAQIAALEADLCAAAAVLMEIAENHGGGCGSCASKIRAVLSRPGVAALMEDTHDG